MAFKKRLEIVSLLAFVLILVKKIEGGVGGYVRK
jgi:hypothetical protein